MTQRLILASASPQRVMLLQGLGVHFEIIPSAVEENSCAEKDPGLRAKILASWKAKEIWTAHPGSWVIGCDTLVVTSDGTILEKPHDAEDAKRMITLQSGRISVVHSGLTVIDPDGKEWTDLSSSKVTFKKLSDEDIDAWVASGIWKDRSGAFQIDGRGQLLIARLDGDWTSVVGLPVYLLGELARKTSAPFLKL